MFGFGRNSKERKLRKKYDKLMTEAFELSKINRKQSDAKYAEADKLMTLIEGL